jgi:hypothetical protein
LGVRLGLREALKFKSVGLRFQGLGKGIKRTGRRRRRGTLHFIWAIRTVTSGQKVGEGGGGFVRSVRVKGGVLGSTIEC